MIKKLRNQPYASKYKQEEGKKLGDMWIRRDHTESSTFLSIDLIDLLTPTEQSQFDPRTRKSKDGPGTIK
jgi:hypothetical protein